MSKYMLIMRGSDKPPIKVPLRAVNNVYNFKYGFTSYKMSAAWERNLLYSCYFDKQQFREKVAHYVGGTVNMLFLEEALCIFESRHPMTEAPGLTYKDIPCFAKKDTGVEIISYKQNFVLTLELEKELLNIIKDNQYRSAIMEIELRLLRYFGNSLKGGSEEAARNFLNQHGVNTRYFVKKPVEKVKPKTPTPLIVVFSLICSAVCLLALYGISNSLMDAGSGSLFDEPTFWELIAPIIGAFLGLWFFLELLSPFIRGGLPFDWVAAFIIAKIENLFDDNDKTHGKTS